VVAKTYHVTLDALPTGEDLQRLRKGVLLSDGVTRPARVRRVGSSGSAPTLEFVLTEGRNRQIRRMCAAVGRKVRRLVRVGIGAYLLGELSSGAWRVLGDADVRRLIGRS
jgi:pseudouridine synthase